MTAPINEPQALEQIQASDYRTIYTNHIQAGFSPLDVTLILSQVIAIQDRYGVENKARVIVTPVEAKILLNILKNTIKNYESKYGEINVPIEVAVPEL